MSKYRILLACLAAVNSKNIQVELERAEETSKYESPYTILLNFES